ncbi:MAG TPA: TerB family tellurite resistance protein [Devosiaceae bacterium]|jgi:uncharacterized tellurite resistance protein B-like protein
MFEALSRLFKSDAPVAAHDPRLSVAALLVHLAAVDGAVKPEERQAVKGALQDFYGLEEDEVDRLIAEAMRRDADAVDFYQFTSSLSSLDSEDRVEIVRMMWQVVFADKKNHELEDNMVWRIAELIGVSSRDRTVLRNQIAKGRLPS